MMEFAMGVMFTLAIEFLIVIYVTTNGGKRK